MNRTLVLSLPVAMFLASACREPTVSRRGETRNPLEEQLPACIEVDPPRIVFDDVDLSVDQPAVEQRTVTLRNACEGPLRIASLGLGPDAPSGVFSLLDFSEPSLQPGAETTFHVTFEPADVGQATARILIDSNDEANPTTTVRLEGNAIAPRIVVTPETVDYGQPFIGCENEQPLQIRNEGNAPLIVDEITLYTGATDQFQLDLSPAHNGRLPFTLAPYDPSEGTPVVDVYLDYLPLDDFEDQAWVEFASNDPFQREVVTEAEASGTFFGDNQDVFEQPIRTSTDILFTLDRSGSMSDDNELVINNFDVFVRTLSGLDADYHATVVVADDGCVVGPLTHIDNTFDEESAKEAFRTMADPGRSLAPTITNTERGYMLAEGALSRANTGSGGCNEGFYRDDAFLSIVHVSDEPDQSVNTWSYYIGLFQGMKEDPDDVKVNAVAGDYPRGCGLADPGVGYYEGTVATGGLFLSICADDWADKLEDLALESVNVKDTFVLSAQPVPQTIQVTVDGVPLRTGWFFDLSPNAVVFERDFIPAGGSRIEIDYDVRPACGG